MHLNWLGGSWGTEPGLTPRVQELVLALLLAGLVPVQLGLEAGTFHFFLCFPIPFIVLG